MLHVTSLQMKHKIYTDPKIIEETNIFEHFMLNLQANENGATENKNDNSIRYSMTIRQWAKFVFILIIYLEKTKYVHIFSILHTLCMLYF